jgi:hypothetical protein
MVVQREDTTGMGTILLEEVYLGHFVKFDSSETVVGSCYVMKSVHMG